MSSSDHRHSFTWKEVSRIPVAQTNPSTGQRECAELVWEQEECSCGAKGGTKSHTTSFSPC